MPEKTVSDEQAIIEKILHRRSLNEPRISAEKMKQFKTKLGEEIQRNGALSKEYVDQLLQQMRNGEL